MQRGDILTVAAPGGFGKARHAELIPSDLLNPTLPRV
jgi:hypothetical protein